MSVEKFTPSENMGIPKEVYDEFIIDTDVHLDLQMLEDLYPYMDDQIVKNGSKFVLSHNIIR